MKKKAKITPGRLSTPPHSGLKHPLQVEICRLLKPADLVDYLGTVQIIIHPETVAHDDKEHHQWLCDPETEPVFWVRQRGGVHSVIVYDEKIYAVASKHRKDVRAGGEMFKARVLGLQPIDIDLDEIDWIKSVISDRLME